MDREVQVADEPTDYGEVVGRCFVDKLLLSVIDAYPDPTTSPASAARRRRARLREAKQALFGGSNPEGRPSDSDEASLRWMGSERYKDLARRDMAKLKGQLVPRPRSERELVDQAVARFNHPGSSGERLRKKFSDQREKWLATAMLHDDVPEQLDFNALEAIEKILSAQGIAMTFDRIER